MEEFAAEWTVEDVTEFLSKIKLTQYIDAMVENDVNGSMLVGLIQEDGLGELGIESKLHKVKIRTQLELAAREATDTSKASAATKEEPASSTPPPPPPEPGDQSTGTRKAAGNRMMDLGSEPLEMLLPLEGSFNIVPVGTIDEAAHDLRDDVQHASVFANQCKALVQERKLNGVIPMDFPDNLASGLSYYTAAWLDPEESFYYKLNSKLRAKKRAGVKPFFRMLKLITEGMLRLQPHCGLVWRGVKAELAHMYPKGKIVTWWAVSSCTLSMSALEEEIFLGKTGKRTLFSIMTNHSYNVKIFSFFQEEEEVLLPPGLSLEVIDLLDLGHGAHIVQLKEVDSPHCLLDLAREAQMKSGQPQAQPAQSTSPTPTPLAEAPPAPAPPVVPTPALCSYQFQWSDVKKGPKVKRLSADIVQGDSYGWCMAECPPLLSGRYHWRVIIEEKIGDQCFYAGIADAGNVNLNGNDGTIPAGYTFYGAKAVGRSYFLNGTQDNVMLSLSTKGDGWEFTLDFSTRKLKIQQLPNGAIVEFENIKELAAGFTPCVGWQGNRVKLKIMTFAAEGIENQIAACTALEFDPSRKGPSVQVTAPLKVEANSHGWCLAKGTGLSSGVYKWRVMVEEKIGDQCFYAGIADANGVNLNGNDGSIPERYCFYGAKAVGRSYFYNATEDDSNGLSLSGAGEGWEFTLDFGARSFTVERVPRGSKKVLTNLRVVANGYTPCVGWQGNRTKLIFQPLAGFSNSVALPGSRPALEWDPSRCGAQVSCLEPNLVQAREDGWALAKGPGLSGGTYRWKVTVQEKIGDQCYYAGVCDAQNIRLNSRDGCPPSEYSFHGVKAVGRSYKIEEKVDNNRLSGVTGDSWEFTLDSSARTMKIKHSNGTEVTLTDMKEIAGGYTPCVGWQGNESKLRITPLSGFDAASQGGGALEWDPGRCGAKVTCLEPNMVQAKPDGWALAKCPGVSTGVFNFKVRVQEKLGDQCYYAGMCDATAIRLNSRDGCPPAEYKFHGVKAVGRSYMGTQTCDNSRLSGVTGDEWDFTLDCNQRTFKIRHSNGTEVTFADIEIPPRGFTPCVGWQGNESKLRIHGTTPEGGGGGESSGEGGNGAPAEFDPSRMGPRVRLIAPDTVDANADGWALAKGPAMSNGRYVWRVNIVEKVGDRCFFAGICDAAGVRLETGPDRPPSECHFHGVKAVGRSYKGEERVDDSQLAGSSTGEGWEFILDTNARTLSVKHIQNNHTVLLNSIESMPLGGWTACVCWQGNKTKMQFVPIDGPGPAALALGGAPAEFDPARMGPRVRLIAPDTVDANEDGWALAKGPAMNSGKYVWHVNIVEKVGDRCFFAGICDAAGVRLETGPDRPPPEFHFHGVKAVGRSYKGEVRVDDSQLAGSSTGEGWEFILDTNARTLSVKHIQNNHAVLLTDIETMPPGGWTACVCWQGNKTKMQFVPISGPGGALAESIGGAPAEFDPNRMGPRVRLIAPDTVDANEDGWALAKGPPMNRGKYSWQVNIVEKVGDQCFFAGMCDAAGVRLETGPDRPGPEYHFHGVKAVGRSYKGEVRVDDNQLAGSATGQGWVFVLDTEARTLSVKHIQNNHEVLLRDIEPMPPGGWTACVCWQGNRTKLQFVPLSGPGGGGTAPSEWDPARIGPRCSLDAPNIVGANSDGWALAKGPPLNSGKFAWRVKIHEKIGDRCFYAGMCDANGVRLDSGPDRPPAEFHFHGVKAVGRSYKGGVLVDDSQLQGNGSGEGWEFNLDTNARTMMIKHITNNHTVTLTDIESMPQGWTPCVGWQGNRTKMLIEPISGPGQAEEEGEGSAPALFDPNRMGPRVRLIAPDTVDANEDGWALAKGPAMTNGKYVWRVEIVEKVGDRCFFAGMCDAAGVRLESGPDRPPPEYHFHGVKAVGRSYKGEVRVEDGQLAGNSSGESWEFTLDTRARTMVIKHIQHNHTVRLDDIEPMPPGGWTACVGWQGNKTKMKFVPVSGPSGGGGVAPGQWDPARIGPQCTLSAPDIVETSRDGWALAKGPALRQGKFVWQIKIVEKIGDRCFFAGMVDGDAVRLETGPDRPPAEYRFHGVKAVGRTYKDGTLRDDNQFQGNGAGEGWEFGLDTVARTMSIRHLTNNHQVTLTDIGQMPPGGWTPCVGWQENKTRMQIIPISASGGPPAQSEGVEVSKWDPRRIGEKVTCLAPNVVQGKPDGWALADMAPVTSGSLHFRVEIVEKIGDQCFYAGICDHTNIRLNNRDGVPPAAYAFHGIKAVGRSYKGTETVDDNNLRGAANGEGWDFHLDIGAKTLNIKHYTRNHEVTLTGIRDLPTGWTPCVGWQGNETKLKISPIGSSGAPIEWDPSRKGPDVYFENNNVGAREDGWILSKGNGFTAGIHTWKITVIEKIGDECYYAGMCDAANIRLSSRDGVPPAAYCFHGIKAVGRSYKGTETCDNSGLKGDRAGVHWTFELNCSSKTFKITHSGGTEVLLSDISIPVGGFTPCAGWQGNGTKMSIERVA